MTSVRGAARNKIKLWSSRAAATVLVLATGCAVGPNYRRPAVSTPEKFKELAGWKQAEPSETARSSAWWKALRDPMLDDLEEEVATSNQTVLQDAATYEQARELARSDWATFWPTVSAQGSAIRANEPAGRGGTTSTASSSSGGVTVLAPASGGTNNAFSASLDASWAPDFWGRIRRLTEADVAAAQTSAADLAAARLSLQETLAQDYIGLRAQDDKLRLLENAVKSYVRTLTITKNKYSVGVAAQSDVVSAQAQVEAAQAQELDAGVQRAEFEHAIAVLVGKSPAQLTIARRPLVGLSIPSIPTGVPSELLERRPDVAAAERAAASANARVGVQMAAYFPTITLSAAGGYEASALAGLFSAPNRFWTLGGNAAETLLDFGQRRAEVLQARAAYDGSVANYRQTVLTAFQQVEDDLASLRILGEEAKVEDIAVSDAATATRITVNEYDAGTVDYTTVVTAEVNELTDREAALTILQNRLDAAVALMQALGGGWAESDLPSRGRVMARKSQAPSAVAAPP